MENNTQQSGEKLPEISRIKLVGFGDEVEFEAPAEEEDDN